MTSVYVTKEILKHGHRKKAEKGLRKFLQTDNVFLFVPNIIDYIRLGMLLSFMYHSSVGDYKLAVISYVISFVLDEVDGNCARYFGQTSVFGMILDIFLDEASVTCLCMVLATLYPQYVILFQLYSTLDFLAQWSNYYFAALYKDNKFTSTDDWLIHAYFNKYVLTLFWVYGNHIFLLMLYLCYFTQGPEVTLFGVSIGLWKLLAYCFAPWSMSRLTIMMYLLFTTMRNLGNRDCKNRIQARQQDNSVQDDQASANGYVITSQTLSQNGYQCRSSSRQKN